MTNYQMPKGVEHPSVPEMLSQPVNDELSDAERR